MNRVCVFCGSSTGRDPAYAKTARALGRALVERGIELVYGGGGVGLMGEIAGAVMQDGGLVTGVIPEPMMAREIGNLEVTDLRVVGSMHERKAVMVELSDGFVALPGGLGTFEEFFEVVTWAQLGIPDKPCGLLNVAGYFDPLLALFDHAHAEGFVAARHRQIVLSDNTPQGLLDAFAAYEPPKVEKWLARPQT